MACLQSLLARLLILKFFQTTLTMSQHPAFISYLKQLPITTKMKLTESLKAGEGFMEITKFFFRYPCLQFRVTVNRNSGGHGHKQKKGSPVSSPLNPMPKV